MVAGAADRRHVSLLGEGFMRLRFERLALWASCGVLVALLSPVRLARANGPEIGRDAGAIFPLESPAVQLVYEHITATLPPQGYEYDPGSVVCIYGLRNLTDQAVTFEMSFVTNIPGRFPGVVADQYRRAKFTAQLKGADLPVGIAPADSAKWVPFFGVPVDSLPVWTIELGPREEATLRVSYLAEWSGGADGDHWTRYFEYLATAASLWAGPIEHARVEFVLGDLFVAALKEMGEGSDRFQVQIEPADGKWSWNGVVWERANWEPDEDFRLSFDGNDR